MTGRPSGKRNSDNVRSRQRSQGGRFAGSDKKTGATKRYRKKDDRPDKKDDSGQGGFTQARRVAKKGRKFEAPPRGQRRGDKTDKGRDGNSFMQSKLRKSAKATAPKSTAPKASIKPTGLEEIRLNKFIANSGAGSRRYADGLITQGLITVNGKVVTELGVKVKMNDDVRLDGKKLKIESLVYVLLNKPKGCITTTTDPSDRNTVMNIVAKACKERIYPVGRLDRNTTGLLLLTNDGEMASKLMHPSFDVKKIYKVGLNKAITKSDFARIMGGVKLEEGRVPVDDLAIVGDDSKTLGIELHIGWNKVVRRLFEAVGYEVLKLDRVIYAGLDKKKLGRGQWRFLTKGEIVRLKHF